MSHDHVIAVSDRNRAAFRAFLMLLHPLLQLPPSSRVVLYHAPYPEHPIHCSRWSKWNHPWGAKSDKTTLIASDADGLGGNWGMRGSLAPR